MKTFPFIFCLFISLMLGSACQKEDISKKWQEAIITGYDYARCACCGGLMITLSDNPERYEGDFYRWNRKEGEYDFLDGVEYPIYIEMKFERIEDACEHMRWIQVGDMKLR